MKDQKKTQLLLLKNSEQKHSDGSKSRLLYMTHEYNTAKAVGRPLKPPLWPDPYPHPMEGTSSPPPWGVSKQRKLLLVIIPLCCIRGPSETLLEFVWPLINFC